MTMRITGLASGLDIDALVKDSMKPYKLKVDTQKQQAQILEWKQEQYQEVMNKASTFYNKYLDLTSPDSLYSMGAYNQTKFTSSNEGAVTVTGSSSASIQDYTVTVDQVATKATGKILDATLNTMTQNEANKTYTAKLSIISGQPIEFQATIGSSNEAANLANLKQSINDKIESLKTDYSTTTDASKKSTIESNIKTLGKTLGVDYTVTNGTWTSKAISGYTDTSLKNTMNNTYVETDTLITASDGTNNITSKLCVKLNGNLDINNTIDTYNRQTGASNITAKYSSISGGLIFEARDTGAKTLKINGIDQDGGPGKGTAGTDLIATVKNAYGDSIPVTGAKNTQSIDGVTYTFNAKTTSDVKITGSQDITALKDKIVNFIKDYNDLIGQINGKLLENYDRDYQPLTDDQKEAMSDKQIENWETKAKTGLINRDDDLNQLDDTMKGVMSTFMSGIGIDLEKIGIKPVNDYKQLNGTYEIDEDKLTKALQNNFNDVKDLFMKNAAADTTTDAGIIPKLREVLQTNFIKSDSVFNRKADSTGLFALTSEMSTQILEKNRLIKEMNADLTTRENDFYSKYSKLESALSQAQAQQSQMSAWFSGGSN